MDIRTVGFRYLLLYFIRCNVLFEIMICIVAGVLFSFTKDIVMAVIVPTIFFVGYILPISIHEYMHVYAMRRSHVQTIEIANSLWKVSVKTKERIQGRNLILVALSGPCVCFLLGILLFVVWKITGIQVIKITGYLYMIHLINIVPPLGDGVMIVKGLLTCGDYER